MTKPCAQTNLATDNTPLECDEFISTACVVHPDALVELNLPENSTAQDIFNALLNTIINLNNQIGNTETSTGIEIQDDGAIVINEALKINFTDNLAVVVDSTDVSKVNVSASIPSYTINIDSLNLLSILQDGNIVSSVDLTPYLDDTNLPQTVSAEIVGNDLVFTRDDSSTYSVDITGLINGGSGIQSVVAGTGILIDNTDPNNPIITNTESSIAPTGLEAIDEGNGVGWRLIGRDPNVFGNIGRDAVNLGAGLSALPTAGATGTNSTISGGLANTSSTFAATVSGGQVNTASGNSSVVSGGSNNQATATESTVSGGKGNRATNTNSTIGGGEDNNSSGTHSTVSGGNNNNATGENTSIGGGTLNLASGLNSTISGGRGNTASGESSVVVGGRNNNASGDRSTISGGIDNNTTGSATIAGGNNNNAVGDSSFIGVGDNNTTTGEGATTLGGNQLIANGRYSALLGGNQNTTNGDWSVILGGFSNVTEVESEIIGGAWATQYIPDGLNDRAFTIGNGTLLNRSDAFLIQKTGEIFAPSGTIALIDAAAPRVLITKEWFQANSSSGGVQSVSQGTGVVVDNTDSLNPIVSIEDTETESGTLAQTVVEGSMFTSLGNCTYSYRRSGKVVSVKLQFPVRIDNSIITPENNRITTSALPNNIRPSDNLNITSTIVIHGTVGSSYTSDSYALVGTNGIIELRDAIHNGTSGIGYNTTYFATFTYIID